MQTVGTNSGLYGVNTTDKVVYKFVVDKVNASVSFYIGSSLIFAFTKDAFTVFDGISKLDWGDSLTSVYAEKIAGFFAEGAKIAVGINGAFKYSATATYACSLSDN